MAFGLIVLSIHWDFSDLRRLASTSWGHDYTSTALDFGVHDPSLYLWKTNASNPQRLFISRLFFSTVLYSVESLMKYGGMGAYIKEIC